MRALMLLSLWSVTVPLAAQDAGWEQIGQAEWPYRPSVGEIVRTSTGALLACPFGDGLYRSTDEGEMWAPVSIDANLPGCAVVIASDETLFAGTESGVYRSEDDGVTWSFAGLDRWIYDLERGPDGRLWAIAHEGQFDRALFRSDDGATWEFVADEDAIGAQFVGVFLAITVNLEGIVFLSAQYGLFRSTDDGASWQESEIDESRPGTLPISEVTFMNPDIAYIGARGLNGGGRGLYRSTDSGLTWSATTLPDIAVETLVRTEDEILLIGTDAGLYESADGLAWEPVGLNAPARRIAAILPGEGSEPMVLGTDRGVYRAAGTSDWERINEGFERGLAVSAIAVHGEALFASANGEVYRYDAATDRWQLPENVGLLGDASPLVAYGDALLVGTRAGLFRSEDRGETWEALWLAGGGEEGLTTFSITSDGTFVLGTVYSSFSVQIGQVFFSADEGTTWDVSEGWNDSPGGIPYDIAETTSGTLLVAAIAGKFNPPEVYRSTDGGASWAGRGGDGVTSLAVLPSGTIAGAGSSAHYRSVDDGLTWDVTDSTGGFALTVAPNGGLAAIRDPSFWYIRDIYYSVDEGLTWTQITTELTAASLATDSESFIYAGTGGQGVFRSPEPLFVSSEADTGSPQPFALAPAYPNPAASSMRIPFALSEAGPVTLTVHDVLGRRVATLVEAVLPAGEQEATWDAVGAASGVYIVTLRAGERTAARRIAIAR